MTPEQELQNYLNGWLAKGSSKADLVNLLRAEADKLVGVEAVEDEVEETEEDEDGEGDDTDETETEE